ncbi:MAG: hypothetical protein ACRCZ9_02380 [Fusobacteriaceae bacterium]
MDITKQDYINIILDCSYRLNNLRIKTIYDIDEYIDIYSTCLSIRDNLKEDINNMNKLDNELNYQNMTTLYEISKKRSINMSYKLNSILKDRIFRILKDNK